MSSRFDKLRKSMGLYNADEAEKIKKSKDNKDSLARINDKIAELEKTGDKESLDFWKKKRAQLLAE